jgi:hypothetical protein
METSAIEILDLIYSLYESMLPYFEKSFLRRGIPEMKNQRVLQEISTLKPKFKWIFLLRPT